MVGFPNSLELPDPFQGQLSPGLGRMPPTWEKCRCVNWVEAGTPLLLGVGRGSLVVASVSLEDWQVAEARRRPGHRQSWLIWRQNVRQRGQRRSEGFKVAAHTGVCGTVGVYMGPWGPSRAEGPEGNKHWVGGKHGGNRM